MKTSRVLPPPPATAPLRVRLAYRIGMWFYVRLCARGRHWWGDCKIEVPISHRRVRMGGKQCRLCGAKEIDAGGS
jgi:hypothetical protein